MKYIVAVKYKYDTKIFEFDTEKCRNEFVDEIKSDTIDIALSQIEESEWKLFIFVVE